MYNVRPLEFALRVVYAEKMTSGRPAPDKQYYGKMRYRVGSVLVSCLTSRNRLSQVRVENSL